MTAWLAGALALVLVSAFFSATQAAMRRADIHLADRPPERCPPFYHQFRRTPDRYTSAAMLGSSIANIGLVALAALWVESRGVAYPALVSALTMAPLIFLLGETLPRELGRRRPEKWLRLSGGTMHLSTRLLSPLARGLDRAARTTLLLLMGLEPQELHRRIGRGALGFIFKTGTRDWALTGYQQQMLSSALNFSFTSVREVMVPLTEVTALALTAQAEAAVALSRTTSLTRFPVYDSRIDDVVGIVNVYDILYSDSEPGAPVKKFMRPGLFVPNTVAIDKLLFQMQSRKMPLAIVVDEFGSADGIVTVEDVVDELIGAFEVEPAGDRPIQRQADGVYNLDGHVLLDRLNRDLGLDLPKRSYDTLSGFLMTEMERIPEEGDRFRYGKLSFLVSKTKRHTIHKVQLRIDD